MANHKDSFGKDAPAATGSVKDTSVDTAQPKAATAEMPVMTTQASGSDLPLSTEHPRAAKAEMTAEQKAFLEAQIEAEKARREAEDKRTPEEKAADEKVRHADDLRAKAAEAMSAESGKAKEPTVADVGVLAPVDGKLKSADHFAQKFGNDPENPKLMPGIKPDEDLVRVTRVTPDVPGEVFAMVPRAMVGDYERAGWNRA